MNRKDHIIKARDGEINRLKEERDGYKALVKISQAYVAYLVENEHGGHIEIERDKLREYIEHPEYIRAVIKDNMYVVDIKR